MGKRLAGGPEQPVENGAGIASHYRGWQSCSTVGPGSTKTVLNADYQISPITDKLSATVPSVALEDKQIRSLALEGGGIVSNLRVLYCNIRFYPLIGGAESNNGPRHGILRERGYESYCCYIPPIKKTWLPLNEINGVHVIRVSGNILDMRKHPRIFPTLNLYAGANDWPVYSGAIVTKYDFFTCLSAKRTDASHGASMLLRTQVDLISVPQYRNGCVKGSPESRSLLPAADHNAEWLHVDGVTLGLMGPGKPGTPWQCPYALHAFCWSQYPTRSHQIEYTY